MCCLIPQVFVSLMATAYSLALVCSLFYTQQEKMILKNELELSKKLIEEKLLLA